MLALERLIVGRECNGFDRLLPKRKALAYAELIQLGLAYGKVDEIAGRDYPEVAVQRVSSRGRRLRRNSSRARGSRPKGKRNQALWAFIALAALLIGCLFIMSRYGSN
jgi:hypothetical protein